jgi:predicted methyltransferase
MQLLFFHVMRKEPHMSLAYRHPATGTFSTWLVVMSLAWGGNGNAASQPRDAQTLDALYRQAAASPIRTDEDRRADAARKPVEFLQFAQVRPGMLAMDVSAGAGYTTQLLALVVGSKGTVWAQGPQLRPALKERLAAHPQPNIVAVERPFEDPVPSDVPKLDLITLIWNYHDIAYMPVDRAKMDRRLFDALKPGGHLVVIDHSAKAGTGTTAAKTLHRIDEAVVLDEFRQAGFQLEQESDFLRNPADPRDEVIFHMAIPADCFALRFVKP